MWRQLCIVLSQLKQLSCVGAADLYAVSFANGRVIEPIAGNR
jgi:hypothetical protein